MESQYLIGGLIIEDFYFIALGLLLRIVVLFYKSYTKYKSDFKVSKLLKHNYILWLFNILASIPLVVVGTILIEQFDMTWNEAYSAGVSYMALELIEVVEKYKTTFLNKVKNEINDSIDS